MYRHALKRCILSVAMATALLTFSPQRCDAGWWHWGHGGWYAPYATVYRPYVWGWRLAPRYAAYSSWGYYGTCGWSCCDPCCTVCCDPCCDPCCGVSYDPCCGAEPQPISSAGDSSTIAPAPAAPATPPPPAAAPEAPPAAAAPEASPATGVSPLTPPSGAARAARAGKALLSVTVPNSARVLINGHLTRTQGTHRQYISPGLKAGNQYVYHVRAELERDGKTFSDSKVVRLQAGQMVSVAFPLDAQSPVQTVLKLNVPEDAVVTLAGRPTNGTGSVRTFATERLSNGQQWKGYRVVVRSERDGRQVTREEEITLTGGETRELTFAFVGQQLALR